MQFCLLIPFVLLLSKVEGFRYKFQSDEASCSVDEDCQTFIEDSVCNFYKCVCPSNKLLSSDGSKCLEKVQGFGDECEDNVQCHNSLRAGGVCINNECKCKTGFHYLNERCWKNVDLNETCRKNMQCFSAYESVGLECTSEKCKCRPGYYERLNSGCRRKMNVSEACNIDTDCPEGATCNNMICTSTPRTEIEEMTPHFSSTPSSLNYISELGNYCTYDSDCNSINNAVCLDKKICACKPPKYVASEDNKKCLQSTRGKVEDIQKSSCKENVQCAVFGGNSICLGKNCACKNGTYFEVKNQFCWTIKQIGEFCTLTEDCHPSQTHAECKEQVCTCMKGYHRRGSICVLTPTKLGDHCEEDEECSFTSNAFCNESNACACKEYYYPQHGKCLGGVKSNCQTDADCCHLKNTECRSSNSSLQCLCLDNYVSSDDKKYCLPVVKYEKKCQESFQCRTDLGEFGECRDEICKCQNNTHYFYGKCHRSKFVKESCSKLQDCHPGNDLNSVICLKGFCSCNYGYESDSLGFCVKTNSATGVKPYLYAFLAALFLFR